MGQSKWRRMWVAIEFIRQTRKCNKQQQKKNRMRAEYVPKWRIKMTKVKNERESRELSVINFLFDITKRKNEESLGHYVCKKGMFGLSWLRTYELLRFQYVLVLWSTRRLNELRITVNVHFEFHIIYIVIS